jgi:hypothetical protein
MSGLRYDVPAEPPDSGAVVAQLVGPAGRVAAGAPMTGDRCEAGTPEERPIMKVLDPRILAALDDDLACWERTDYGPCSGCVRDAQMKLAGGWSVERVLADIAEFKRRRRLALKAGGSR